LLDETTRTTVEPSRGTRMTVIRKDDGKVVAVHELDPFFTFHHVNAFEERGELVVDLVEFPDATVIEKLYLESLRASEHALGALVRYRLPLKSSTARLRPQRLSAQPIELPSIHYSKFNARSYSHVYAVGGSAQGAFDLLAKIDLDRGSELKWQEEGCHPGEPIFVAAPEAKSEDQGLLLSLVLDARAKRSFLLILDARDLSEKARAFLPHHVPFGFHGQYFEKIRRPS
jgi:carotenoid cleavage dioxygenase-like enzyme